MRIIINETQFRNLLEEVEGVKDDIIQFKPSYIKKFGQGKYDNLLQDLLSKKISKDEFVDALKQQKYIKNPIIGSTRGIKMTSQELDIVEYLTSKIKAGHYFEEVIEIEVEGRKTKCLVVSESMPGRTVGYQETTMHDKRLIPSIHMNADYLKTWDKEDLKKSIYHELTHVKDTRTKKTGLPYLEKAREYHEKAQNLDSNSIEYDNLMKSARKYYNKYQFSPEEFNANNQMIINNLVSKTNNLIKKYGKYSAKNKIIDMLDNIVNYFKGNTDLSKESQSLFAKEGVEYIEALKSYDEKMYQQFLKKLILQIQDLKSNL